MTDENLATEQEDLETSNQAEDLPQEEEVNEEEQAAKAAADLEAKKQRKRERNNRRLAAHTRKLEEQLQKAREENAYLRGQSSQQQTQPQEVPKPSMDDYDTQEEYLDALTDWKIAKAADSLDDDQADQGVETETPQTQPIVDQEVFDAYLENGEDQYGEDFAEMLEAAKNGEFDCSLPMTEFIYESEVGPALSIYLYENPREATKIAKMSPTKQVREMVKLEGKMTPPENTVSKAPRPASGESRAGATAKATDLSKPMSASEYAKLRRQQMQQRRG